MAELGVLIGEYRTDNRKRVRTGAGMLVAGLIVLAVGVWYIIWTEYIVGPTIPGGPPSEGPLPGGLVGVGICGTAFGVILLVLAVRSRGERFELHERGLVRHRGSGRVEVGWDAVESVAVVDLHRPQLGVRTQRNTWLRRALGTDIVCTVKLRPSGTIRFTAFTADAGNLAGWIRAAVDDGEARRPV
jgi:hypothetical protein